MRVIPQECYGAALLYFTGSKAHNIAIRRIAQDRDLKINEYGVFRGERRVAGSTEESVYHAIGLCYIPPELREDRGEIDAAKENNLPNLIELRDLRGDLHVHTKATDGHHSIKEMAQAARERGFEYLAITDHSQSLGVTGGLKEKQLAQQIDEIERINKALSGITILKGIEANILEGGSLDLPNSILKRLDLVVAAVHGKFNLSMSEQTKRIMHALENPYVTILAHPTGRLIGEREPYSVDLPQIIKKAKARGCFLELNSRPDRLDLTDVHCKMARDEGVLICINSDAHCIIDFDDLRFGIGQARRGWLKSQHVVNTRTRSCPISLLQRRQELVKTH